MPTLQHSKAIEEYYQQVKDKYPDISFERFNAICRSPFNFIKELIRSARLPIIMVKHLGKFVPAVSRVKQRLEAEKVFFEKNIIDEETYKYRSTFLQNYLNDYKNESSRQIIDDLEEAE